MTATDELRRQLSEIEEDLRDGNVTSPFDQLERIVNESPDIFDAYITDVVGTTLAPLEFARRILQREAFESMVAQNVPEITYATAAMAFAVGFVAGREHQRRGYDLGSEAP